MPEHRASRRLDDGDNDDGGGDMGRLHGASEAEMDCNDDKKATDEPGNQLRELYRE